MGNPTTTCQVLKRSLLERAYLLVTDGHRLNQIRMLNVICEHAHRQSRNPQESV